MDSDHVPEKTFLIEFFGLYGRELGNPQQVYHDNPLDIIDFVKLCEIERKPAYISVQPRRAHYKIFGIEKLFFDFDYADKTFINKLDAKLGKQFNDEVKRAEKKERILSTRKLELKLEVMKFIRMITVERKLQPMVVKTMKGYHVYIYFDKIYSLDYPDSMLKEIYGNLTGYFRELYESRFGPLKYSDTSVEKDIFRIARIPLSIHEKSGEQCKFVKLFFYLDSGSCCMDLKEDKVRGLGHFINRSLRESDLKDIIKITKLKLKEKEKKKEAIKEKSNEGWEIKHGFIGKIRPCFQKALDSGEMRHDQRLALINEVWYNGITTFEGLIEVFRPLHDFDGDKPSGSECRYQVQWYLDHEGFNIKPYSCKKIKEFGWCIESGCPVWLKRNKSE